MVRGFFFALYRPGLAGRLKSADDWRERLDALSSFTEPPEAEAVVLHRPSGFPIGAMCLAGIDHINGKAEFSAGFIRGRGTRAIWEAIHYGLVHSFELLGLRKLVFHCLADNHMAVALLERGGAHREGTLRSELALQSGGYADLERYALFRDADWPRLKVVLQRIVPLLGKDADQ